MRFNGEGEPPDRRMGLLYDGYIMPPRATLGDTDVSQWEIGLDGKPADPWQHFIYLVLQRGDTGELFTYTTSSVTGRRAIGNLLRHYDRLQRTHPDMYPCVRLKTGGFNHRDDRVGWVNVPVLAVVGRAPKDSTAKPNTWPPSEWRALVAEGVAEGARDCTVAKLAGYLLCRRVDPFVALEMLQIWNAARCSPPLPAADIDRIVGSIASKELKRRCNV